MKEFQKVTAALGEIASRLVDKTCPATTLRPEILAMTEILSRATPHFSRRTEGIEQEEVRTPNGLAVSPTMAAMCADDYMRTIMFLRGLHDAVVERLKRISGRPLRVLYAGCGPYATLAVPLMTLFPAEDVSVSRADSHQLGEMPNDLITDIVPMVVVDAFEVIDVQHEADQRRAIAPRARQFFLQPYAQVAAVVPARQHVGEAAAHADDAVDRQLLVLALDPRLGQRHRARGGEGDVELAAVVLGLGVEHVAGRVEDLVQQRHRDGQHAGRLGQPRESYAPHVGQPARLLTPRWRNSLATPS